MVVESCPAVGPHGDAGERAGSGTAGTGGEWDNDAYHRDEDDQLWAGVAAAQVRQRLEQDRQQDQLQRKDVALPGLLLRRQSLQTTAVFRVEHHRTYG